MNYFVRKITPSPVRYALYAEDRVILIFGSVAKKKYFPGLKIFSHNTDIGEHLNLNHKGSEGQPDLIENIRRFEKEVLREEMFAYLARQETSPAKLEEWLSQRQVGKPQREECILLAKENNFIDPERYIEVTVTKRKFQGRSWRQVERDLKWNLSPYGYLLPPGLDWEELISSHRYSDEEVLKNFTPPPHLRRHPEKLKRYLLSKGFTPGLIRDYINRLERDDEPE